MGNSRRFAMAREKIAKETPAQPGFGGDIMPGIAKGIVIPIISNSFRIEQIFGGGEDADAGTEKDELTIYEQLIAEWAASIDYPMIDSSNLSRVAQYYTVEEKDKRPARPSYLEFLKKLLITITEEDSDYADPAGKLKHQIQDLRLSDIAKELDYPRFPDGKDDPLRLLARLPLPIYITTSQSNFLERALEAENKVPRTQICFWSGEVSNAASEHLTDQKFIPSVTNPLVYHLYGLEDYPQTLVLSEDDYINFLISMVEDTDMQNPIVPLSLRKALRDSHLLLLGYRLADWEFRVLFSFILKFRKNDDFARRGMFIQLRQSERSIANVEKSIQYFGHYFDRKKFDIEWNNAEGFIQKLWADWNAYRQGQQ